MEKELTVSDIDKIFGRVNNSGIMWILQIKKVNVMINLKVPEGLLYYEYVLLLLGVALFFVMLVLLILFAIQKRPLRQLALFFLIPIIMIGFPGIQKIKYEDGKLEIEKYTQQINATGKNPETERKLKNQLQKFEKRAQNNPESSVLFGKAYASFGDTIRATEFLNNTLTIEPQNHEARRLISDYTRVDIRPIDTFHFASPSNSFNAPDSSGR